AEEDPSDTHAKTALTPRSVSTRPPERATRGPPAKEGAMDPTFLEHLRQETATLRDSGLEKRERIITSPQSAVIRTQDGKEVLNFCANNYLGLADHPRVIKAAHQGLDKHGYGMASVRFICGTQDVHKDLEARLSRFLETEDTILYSSCFDA